MESWPGRPWHPFAVWNAPAYSTYCPGPGWTCQRGLRTLRPCGRGAPPGNTRMADAVTYFCWAWLPDGDGGRWVKLGAGPDPDSAMSAAWKRGQLMGPNARLRCRGRQEGR